MNRLNDQCATRLKVIAVRNQFFGEEVTVAGLIAGRDVLAARESIDELRYYRTAIFKT